MPILPVAVVRPPEIPTPRRPKPSGPAAKRPTPEVDQLGVMQAADRREFPVELTPGEGLVVGDEYLAEG